jgi:hypothetical protein
MVLGAVGWATAQAVNGSGTPNTIPVWTDSGTIGDSSITQSDNGDQTINASLRVNGSLSLPSTTDPNIGVISIGGTPVLHTFGRFNTFVGPNAGNFTTTGVANTATGYGALSSNTSNSGLGGNTATGYNALFSNTEGYSNTATGFAALQSNTSGHANTATGWDALLSNTTGIGNTGTGYSALRSNTSGLGNTATGWVALNFNTTGSANTATGTSALTSNTSGQFNTATGLDALLLNTSGSANTATGFAALSDNKIGSANTAIGVGAGYYVTGDNNIDIGSSVSGPAGESNTIRIGNMNNNRTFIAGISGVATGFPGAAVLVDANGQLGTTSSSRRFKDDIQDMGDASSDLMKLRPVTFRYKQAQEDGLHPLQYGLVAEEVAEVNPGLVQFDKDGQPQTVLYHVLPALLLNEVQKEHQKI